MFKVWGHSAYSAGFPVIAALVASVTPALAGLDTTVAFNLPAGDLARTLVTISRQGGIMISFPPEVVAGRQSAALQGSLTVREAIARVLAGTGLHMVPGAGGVTVVADTGAGSSAAAAGLGDVAAIDVTDQGGGSRFGDVGFQAGDAGTSSRLSGTPTKELANTITTVTQQVLQSQAITNVAEAAQNVSGVTLGASSNAANPTFVIRGFQSTGVIVDGVRAVGLNTSGFGQPPIDDVERVEVLKGPSAMLTGATLSGGGVNVTTKRPTNQVIHDAIVRYGSYGYKTLAFDFGGPISDMEGLTYRLIMSGNAADENYAGYRNPHEYLIAPSVQWTGNDTTIIAGLRYVDSRRPPVQYTFIPRRDSDVNNLHPIFRLQRGVPPINPYLSYSDKTLQLFSEQSHNFGDVFGFNWIFNNRVRYDTSTDLFHTGSWTGGSGPNRTFGTTQTQTNYTFDRLFEQFDLTSTYDAGFARQTVKFGVDYGVSNSTLATYARPGLSFVNPYNSFPLQDLYMPPSTAVPNLSRYDGTTLGYYIIDKFDTLDNRLHITGSVRYDEFRFRSGGGITGNDRAFLSKTEGLTYSAGAVFDVTPYFSVYGNVNTGLIPSQAINDTTLRPNPPESRNQWEAGGRFFLLDKKLALTASYFDLVATNVSLCAPTGCQTTILVPGQSSRGVEFDMQGEILPGLNAIASFASTVTKYESLQYTLPFAGIPQYTASLWATYAFQDEWLRGLTIGAGGRGNSNSTVYDSFNNNRVYNIPGYIVADAFVGYDIGQWSLSFKINNITNKYYYNPSYDPRFIGIGQGRNFLFTARYSFI